MKKFYPLTLVLALVLLFSCKKEEFDPHKINEADLQFMKEMSMANRAEIVKGQLALSHGSHGSVRAFAQTIVQDHQALQTELEELASYLGVEIPSVMSNSQQNLMESLAGYSGHSFDTAYMSSEVSDHQKILALIQMEYNEGNQYGIKGFVNRHFETFQNHYVRADSVKREL